MIDFIHSSPWQYAKKGIGGGENLRRQREEVDAQGHPPHCHRPWRSCGANVKAQSDGKSRDGHSSRRFPRRIIRSNLVATFSRLKRSRFKGQNSRGSFSICQFWNNVLIHPRWRPMYRKCFRRAGRQIGDVTRRKALAPAICLRGRRGKFDIVGPSIGTDAVVQSSKLCQLRPGFPTCGQNRHLRISGRISTAVLVSGRTRASSRFSTSPKTHAGRGRRFIPSRSGNLSPFFT